MGTLLQMDRFTLHARRILLQARLWINHLRLRWAIIWNHGGGLHLLVLLLSINTFNVPSGSSSRSHILLTCAVCTVRWRIINDVYLVLYNNLVGTFHIQGLILWQVSSLHILLRASGITPLISFNFDSRWPLLMVSCATTLRLWLELHDLRGLSLIAKAWATNLVSQVMMLNDLVTAFGLFYEFVPSVLIRLIVPKSARFTRCVIQIWVFNLLSHPCTCLCKLLLQMC